MKNGTFRADIKVSLAPSDELGVTAGCLSMRMAKTAIFSGIVLAGMIVAVLFHYGLSSINGRTWPAGTFLFDPHDRFMDFVNSIACVKDWNPYYDNDNRLGAYFPFAYLCLVPFTMMPLWVAVWCFLLLSIFILILLIIFWCRIRYARGERFLASRDLIIACVVSYPVVFALDRGNIDVWIGNLLLLFLIGLHQEKWGFWLTVPALAAAAALKGYPALFLLLFITERRYIETISVLILAAMFTIGSVAAFDGNILQNWQGFCAGLKLFYEQYVVGVGSLHYSADLYNSLRFLIGNTSKVRFWCGQFSFFFLITAVFFVLFSSVQKWRKTMVIGVTLIFFPLVANDYKLVVLFPGVMELLSLNEPMRFREKATLVLTALLFIPKHYYFFKGSAFSISGIVSPIIVLLISIVLFVDRLAWEAAFSGFWRMCKFYWEPIFFLFKPVLRTTPLREPD